jgi:hypothetical protein
MGVGREYWRGVKASGRAEKHCNQQQPTKGTFSPELTKGHFNFIICLRVGRERLNYTTVFELAVPVRLMPKSTVMPKPTRVS